MAHVPSDTVDLLGTRHVVARCIFKAHDAHAVLGEELNLLSVLTLRMEEDKPFTTCERRQWRVLLTDMLLEAKKSNLSER
jgi:hypothetical protein